jgi:PEGA domain-containing protein
MIPSERCDVGRDRAASALGAAFAALLVVAPARADPGDSAAAEALFRSARDLVEAGDYAGGCPKFEASLALNPSASTMLNIAKCHEHDGKLATAWSDYNRALVLSHETKGADRKKKLEALASKGIADLAPRLPKLKITLGARPPGVTVARDGSELPTAALGEALPADPGPHEVRATAPGYTPVTRSVTLEEGKTAEVAITLESAAPAAVEKPAGGVPTWAWISGGVGVALAGASIYFLVDDLGAISALRSGCQTSDRGTYCGTYRYDLDNSRKNRDFPLFLGLGGAGLLGIGAAVVGIVRAPPANKPPPPPTVGVMAAPWIGPGNAGAMVTGSF